MIQTIFLALALLLAPSLSSAQFVIKDGTPSVASAVVQSAMPAGKIYIDLATLKKPREAFKTQRIQTTCIGTYAYCQTIGGQPTPNRYSQGPGEGFGSVNSGSFRISCAFSHVAFDDPIVYPGETGRTHLHMFFGNTKTRAVTNLDDMTVDGDSTCVGGTFNRTGYWAPVLVYHCPAATAVARGCDASRDGEVHVSTSANFYYKCSQSGDCDQGGYGNTPLQWWPRGMRMIAGDPTGNNPLSGEKVTWRCNNEVGPVELYRGGTIPSTVVAGCNDLEVTVNFPTCWDGVNKDSPGNHNAHVAYTNYGTPSCNDPAFPVLTPELGLNIHTTVAEADVPFMRLSSDPPYAVRALAGQSAHADWVNGWDQTTIIPQFGMTITDAIKQECYSMFYSPRPRHSDCHNHLLGDPAHNNTWWTLY